MPAPQTPSGERPARVAAPAPIAREVEHLDLRYAEGVAKDPRRNELDLYVPAGLPAPPPLVLFVHGGTWTGGNKEVFGFVGRVLARRGIACAVTNMQLFPFVRPDAMVRDCALALGYLRAQAGAFGCDPERLFVMGHSSGAHLAAWLGFDQRLLAGAGVPAAALRGVLLLSGVYDVRARHPLLDAVFGDDDDLRRAASPGRLVDGRDPPAMVLWGEHDLPCFDLAAGMLCERLRAAAVPFAAQQLRRHDHADYLFRLGSAGDAVLPAIERFVASPGAAVLPPAPPNGPATVLWCVGTADERPLAAAAQRALAAHGVDVVPCEADAVGFAQRFAGLRAQLLASERTARLFAAGFGRGGTAVARAELLPGFAGRIALAPDADLATLRRAAQVAPVLLVTAEGDETAAGAPQLPLLMQLLAGGLPIQPIGLRATSTADALRGVEGDESLLGAVLRAFVHAPQ